MVVKDVAVNTLDPDELSLQLKREMIEYPSRVGWCVPTDVFAERGQALPKNVKEVFLLFVSWVVVSRPFNYAYLCSTACCYISP